TNFELSPEFWDFYSCQSNQKKMSYLFYKYLFSIPKYSLLQMVYLN
ncbi:hypothetical protein M111_4393, partial [Bacteroides fragilis str. 3986T(B)10]